MSYLARMIASLALCAVMLTANVAWSNDGQPRIGLPPETLYEVIDSREVLKGTPQCGFNDLSIPNPAIYLQLTLQPYRMVNGQKVKDGPIQIKQIFLRCQ